MTWTLKHPRMTLDHLGLLPDIFLESDPRPAREQAADRYAHGGGWNPFRGFKQLPSGDLQYPNDEPTKLLAETTLPLTKERIRFYEHAWVSITQEDGSIEISRMD